MRKTRTVRIPNILKLVVVFLFVIISAKLIYVGLFPVVDGINIKEFADNRNTRKETLNANRGSIFDRNKEVLAQDVNSYTVIAYLSPSRTEDMSHPYHVVDKKMTAKKLSPIINMTEERILELLNYDAYQVELGPGGRGITELVKEEIEKLNLPGIDFIKSVKRYYPNANFLSNQLGYAKTTEKGNVVGELGLELFYDKQLTGKNGYKEYQSDINGYQIANTEPIIEEAVPGSDITLTIDTNIQIFVEEAIARLSEHTKDWAFVSIMNAKTGEILGVSATPNFDPNIKDVKSYYDPFVSYQFEPGSTMKIFSFMAAIENGLYKGDELYNSGSLMIGKDKVSDWNRYGWGKISFDRGFYASSNTAATLLAQRLGKGKLKNFYDTLGFGQKTGINLPNEQKGKIAFKYDIELANAAFGQGITVTPVQMLGALSVLGNEGVRVKPHIVKEIKKGDEITYKAKRTEVKKVASPKTIDKVLTMMKGVVNELDDPVATGTNFHLDEITIAGKTGTAEIASPNGGYLTGYYDYIRSFAGVFPYEDPEIIVYALGSKLNDFRILPNTVKTLVKDVSTYLNLITNEIKVEDGIYKVDSFINRDINKTKEDLLKNKFEVTIIGNGKNIIDQYPKKGMDINRRDRIFLLTDGNEIKLPNMNGWSRNEVKVFSNLTKVPISFNGYGFVTKSNVPYGTVINDKTKIEIELKNKYEDKDKSTKKE